jgi:type IV pilus assembly protein PilW
MIMHRHNSMKNIHGVTLIELMLAVAISAILLLGVGTLYGNSKRTYTVDEEFARLQENARFAMKYLVEDIRMAGYMGCVNNNNTAGKLGCFLVAGSYVCDNTSTSMLDAGLVGFEAANTNPGGAAYALQTNVAAPYGLITAGPTASWTNSTTPALPAQLTAARPPVAGSDIIIIHHGNDRSGRLSLPTNNAAAATLTIADPTNAGLTGTPCHTPSDICVNDIVIVSDCQKARVFQATALANAGGTIQITAGGAPGNIAFAWDPPPSGANFFSAADTEVMKLRTYAYFVANNSAGHPALFRHNGIAVAGFNNLPEELVEGIENMQILYGVDTDADGVANQYSPASAVNFTNPANPIVSVRISLLVRSRDNIPNRPTVPQTYPLAGTGITNSANGPSSTGLQPDQRLRKIFTTTIKIRNKGL